MRFTDYGYTNITNLYIYRDRVEEALEALHRVFGEDRQYRYELPLYKDPYKKLMHLLEEIWFYKCNLTNNGDIVIDYRNDAEELGDSELLWNTLAPYLSNGTIEWQGEASMHQLWMWEFEGGVMYDRKGYVVYTERVMNKKVSE